MNREHFAWCWLVAAAMLSLGTSLASAQSSQPEKSSANSAEPRSAATQGDEVDLVRPAVTSASPVMPAGPRTGEVVVAPPPETPAAAKKKPLTPDQLLENILETAGTGGASNIPDPDAVHNSLGTDNVKTPVGVVPSRPTKSGEVVPLAKPDTRHKLIPEGEILRDRVGYVRRDRGRFEFVFEADRSGNIDPPLALLPNALLDSILAQSRNGEEHIHFRVTGTVTQYQQTNYLLLQMVLVEENLDRF